MDLYRQHLEFEGIRPKTREFREAGIKLVLRSWPGIEEVNTRKITARAVEEWLRRFYFQAKPHAPKNAKSPAKNSTGANATTIKCALDAMRYVLDVAVDSGLLYANPARNPSVGVGAKIILKVVRRKRAERGWDSARQGKVHRSGRFDPKNGLRGMQGCGGSLEIHCIQRSEET